MLTPDPVEALLRHAQRNDDVNIFAILVLFGVSQCRDHAITFHWFVIDKIGNLQEHPNLRFYQLKTGLWISPLPFTEFPEDMFHFLNFVFRAFARSDMWNMQNGFLGWI